MFAPVRLIGIRSCSDSSGSTARKAPRRTKDGPRHCTATIVRRRNSSSRQQLNQIVGEAMLAKDGHDVVVVADGLEALAAVQERSYDLVLMDMQMPLMDGIEAARRIRGLDTSVRNIPIVALTANVMAEEIASCREAGMNDHLAKPIDLDLLRQIIATWAPHADSRPDTAAVLPMVEQCEEKLNAAELSRRCSSSCSTPSVAQGLNSSSRFELAMPCVWHSCGVAFPV
jgi:CheY-like chemotaxis protein